MQILDLLLMEGGMPLQVNHYYVSSNYVKFWLFLLINLCIGNECRCWIWKVENLRASSVHGIRCSEVLIGGFSGSRKSISVLLTSFPVFFLPSDMT